MKKIIISILFCTATLWAGLVNAIAILVNDTPITLYDIDKEVQSKQISQNEAVSGIIDKILYDQAIADNRISVDIFDVDDYISRLAATNKMDVIAFKSLVRQQQDYNLFIEDIKKQLLHQKLIRTIAQGKVTIASEDDLEIYYYNNTEKQFMVADTIEVVAYVSKNKNALVQIQKNPMIQNKDVMVQTMTMKQEELNAQTKYILNNTLEKDFSVIFAQNQHYNMFFVKEKKDIVSLRFEDVKEKIFQTIMKKREQDYLKEYFETAKITADIKVLR